MQQKLTHCKPTILQKYIYIYILIKKRKEQTLANYNRYSTQEHRVPSSQNTDQPVRRGADRRQGPTAAHMLAASPGRLKL